MSTLDAYRLGMQTQLMPNTQSPEIDETGKSAEWIARFGREAIAAKERAYNERAAAYDRLTAKQKRAYIARCDWTDSRRAQ